MTGDDLIAFCDSNIPLNEKGKPWSLASHQRRGIARMWERDYSLRLWGEPKKSGKTFLAGCVGIAESVLVPDSEVVVISNDKDQARSRVFRTCAQLIEKNAELSASARVLADEIRFTNGSLIKAVAQDFRGEAGGRQRVTIGDEIWAFDSETARRFFEEMTPPPTEDGAYILIVSYAGFTGEGQLLEDFYKRGLAGKRIDRKIEIYRDDGLCMFWSHVGRQPWQLGSAGKKYYQEQRRTLRPNTFLRLHENRWVSAESAFISAEQWDAIVDASLSPMMANKQRVVFVTTDIGIKRDSSAVIGVYYDDAGKLCVAFHRIWKPTRIEQVRVADVEDYLIDICQRYNVGGIWADPSQFLNSIQTLGEKGITVQEFTQTVEHLTRAGQNLFDLITGKNLIAYANAELREHVLNAVAQETPRGFRLVKGTASKKIDAAIALAMAALRAIENGNPGLAGDEKIIGVGTPRSMTDEAFSRNGFTRSEYGRSWIEEL